ncbi:MULTISPECIES: IS630 family transposase [unclassified Streptomyces]|uniref:IS630 family transposase n=1 Tax=unclassified Streptomyces TaxID=2593676 RepID=UPI00210B48F3|nr:IS630 family transposase [Streptomyces sp. LcepLS]
MSDLVGDARHLSPSAQEALRLRAVAGRDREDVAAMLGVSLRAVDKWWAKWQAGDREALVMRPRGKPVGMHQALGEAEQAAVRQAVLDHRPCDVGLSGQLWTRRLIGDLIAKLYRVRLTEPGVGKYLKRWGLSFQRPDKRAVEQNPEAVRRWHEEVWPEIRVKAKVDGGEILFADQVGIRSDQVTGRTWGEKGKTPVVRRSGNRFSVNAMSAISTKGRMHFMVFTESFTAEVMCRFLDRLAGHFDHKVHLVVDGHSAHRSRRVRDWLATHPDAVELHFLPPYSPELNPDEVPMDRFTVEVPWGISRIESSGSGVDIPEVDPVEAPVGANEQCVVMSVIHGDVGLVAVDVEFGVGDDRAVFSSMREPCK